MRDPHNPVPGGPGGQLLFYQTEGGKLKIEVRFVGNTVWLSLNQLSELFQRDKSVISRHIKNIFEEGELTETAVVANFATSPKICSASLPKPGIYQSGSGMPRASRALTHFLGTSVL